MNDDIHTVKASFNEELATLEYVEGDVNQIERWLALGDAKEGKDGRIAGQWWDESGRGVKRELRPEMFI